MILSLIPSAVLIFFGGYFSLKYSFIQFRPIKIIRSVFSGERKENEISPYSAFASSLAGAAGVGSLSGVALAIKQGGNGAVFWIIVSAFFGMAVKYAECRVCARSGEKSPEYIERSMGCSLSSLFSSAGCLSSFFTGCAVQTSEISKSIDNSGFFGVASVAVVSLLCVLTLSGGARRVSRVCSFAVPFMTSVFVFASLFCIFKSKIGFHDAVKSVFTSAFHPKDVKSFLLAVKSGISVGIFSNEAGLGTASIAYSGSKCVEREASLGIIDVFADTVLMAGLSAAVLLSGGFSDMPSAFLSVFGSFGNILYTVSVLLFGASAMITWSYYGFTFLSRIFGDCKLLYCIFFVVFAVVGTFSTPEILFDIAGIANGIMIILNMISVFRLTG